MDDSRRDKSASEFADIGRDMFLAGLVGSHSGNMSVRLDDRVVITRRGARLGRLSADDLVEFRLFHDEIPYEASTESSVHLAVYAISDHVAVIHAHRCESRLQSLPRYRCLSCNSLTTHRVRLQGREPVSPSSSLLISPARSFTEETP